MNPTGVNPEAFGAAQWGILGILAFVIVLLLVLVYKLFGRLTDSQTRDKTIMEFVDKHRAEHAAALKGMSDTVATAYRELQGVITSQATVLAQQGVMMNELLAGQRIVAEVNKLRRREDGTPASPTETEVARAVKTVLLELRSSSLGTGGGQ